MKYALVEITEERSGVNFLQLKRQNLTKSDIKGIIKGIRKIKEMISDSDYSFYGEYFDIENSHLSIEGGTLLDYKDCKIIPMWNFDDFLNE